MLNAEKLEKIFNSITADDLESLEEVSEKDIKEAKSEIQRRLLKQTIKFAYETIPYYSKLYRKNGLTPDNVNDLNDLSKLPILTKQDVQQNLPEMLSRKVNIISMKLTSGTDTMGIQSPVYISAEEIRSRESMLSLMSKLGGQPSKLCLRLVFRRGAMSQTPKTQHFMITWPYILDDPNRIVLVMDELLREHPIYGKKCKVTTLILPVPWVIKDITYELQKINVNPKEFGIKEILCSGGHVTRHLREFVRQIWGAEIYNAWSMVEVCGSAVECNLHSMYHFDLTMIPEVLDPDSKEPVGYGEEGVLTLTTLYPFQQAMPLIRYWTNDLVILSNEACPCGFKGISIKKYIGRKEYCPDLRGILPSYVKRKFFSYIDFLEVIEAIPEVSNLMKITSHYDSSSLTIKISVVLRRNLTREKTYEITKTIEERLMETYNEWRAYFENGKIKILVELLPSFYMFRTVGGFFRV